MELLKVRLLFVVSEVSDDSLGSGRISSVKNYWFPRGELTLSLRLSHRAEYIGFSWMPSTSCGKE